MHPFLHGVVVFTLRSFWITLSSFCSQGTASVASLRGRHRLNAKPNPSKSPEAMCHPAFTIQKEADRLHQTVNKSDHSLGYLRRNPRVLSGFHPKSPNCWDGENKARLRVGWTDESFYRKNVEDCSLLKSCLCNSRQHCSTWKPCYSITSLLALCGFWHFTPLHENNLFRFHIIRCSGYTRSWPF